MTFLGEGVLLCWHHNKLPEDVMASYEQTLLEQITQIHGVDFTTWQGWQSLMDWVKRQSWRKDFFGGDRIPARLLHPSTLVTELTRYLGG